MLEHESLSTDILVVGSGIAGMIAAIEARKAGAEVVLASRRKLGKESSTAVARTFAFGSEEETKGRNMPGYDNKPGKYIEDWTLVKSLSEEAPVQIENLISLGVPMVRIPADKGYEKLPSYRPTGSDAAHGGAIVLDILGPVARKLGIRVVEGCQITNLLRDEGRIAGASGLRQDGGWLAIHARAVILATGGAAGMSEVTCSSREVCGNGYAMALKAGIHLKNMEFNEYYPVGLPTPRGQHVHCAPLTLMMKGACLRNEAGEDVVKNHFGISVQEAMPTTTMRFDWLPRAVALEMERGKVHLDLTGVPAEDWDRLPERNWRQIRQTHVDLKRTLLPIMPMSIAFRGGISVDARRWPGRGGWGT
ncbi:MAG: succinate dehydrogenase subunit [Dehalococcoidia bacterium]|nr:succinate dehydrogenase subunit [Dehalococcoidia bacterium]